MSSVLDSVKWSKPALALLKQCTNIDPNLPAVMHIRHTERPKATEESFKLSIKTGKSTLYSTEKGKQAAYEFGKMLPDNRQYRIYHSPIDRSRETAEKIHEGLLYRQADSTLVGAFLRLNHDRVKNMEYLKRDIVDAGEANARQYLFNHISGHFPPWEIESGILIAKRHAEIMLNNLKSAKPYTFDVYVSHDTVCALFLFYWFGVVVDENWVEFLDGFIMQQTDNRLILFTKDGKREVHYPYWWKSLT